MRRKGLVVSHSPANALLVGLDPARGLLAGHLSFRDRSSDSRDDGVIFLVFTLPIHVRALLEAFHPGFGFLFGQLACLRSVLFMCRVEISLH